MSLYRGLKRITYTTQVFSYIYQPDGLNTLLSQGLVLENGSHYGNGGQRVHSKDAEGDKKPLIA